MNETTISVKKYILTYGLILGLAWCIYSVFRHATGNRTTTNWAFSVFELILHIGIISYGIYKFKSNNHSFLTLWQALKIGMGIAITSTLLIISWDIFFLKVITPETIQEVLNSAKQSAIKKISDKDQILNQANHYLLNRSIGSLTFHLTFGFLVSLLGGAIMQKNPDPFD